MAHLFRRAAFGASGSELDAAAAAGFDKTVDALIGGLDQPDAAIPPVPHLSTIREINEGKGGDSYEEYPTLVGWWLEKMARTPTPLREKLTVLLHGQFPVGFDKVGVPIYMYHQNEIFRRDGAGAIDSLTLALAKDPAMMIWLDLNSNQRLSPNENFARELMERFTMGIGNYSQHDVREAARALTGWSVSYQTGAFEFDVWAHDYGEKTLLGYHGDLSGQDVVHIVTHSAASARWIPARVWSFLAYPVGPGDPVVADLSRGYAADLDMTNLLRAIFKHPNFVSTTAREGLIKQPIEWVAGIMRAFGLRVDSFKKSGGAGFLLNVMTGLGQIPFNPPTVGGWGNNEFWLSSASSLAQLNFAQSVVAVADLSRIEEAAGPARVDALADLLAIDSWSPQSRAVLQRTRDDIPKLVALALTAPETIAN